MIEEKVKIKTLFISTVESPPYLKTSSKHVDEDNAAYICIFCVMMSPAHVPRQLSARARVLRQKTPPVWSELSLSANTPQSSKVFLLSEQRALLCN